MRNISFIICVSSVTRAHLKMKPNYRDCKNDTEISLGSVKQKSFLEFVRAKKQDRDSIKKNMKTTIRHS